LIESNWFKISIKSKKMSQEHLDREEQIKLIIPHDQLALTKIIDYHRQNFRRFINSRLESVHQSLKQRSSIRWVKNFGDHLIKSCEMRVGNQLYSAYETNPITGELQSVPYIGWFDDHPRELIQEE